MARTGAAALRETRAEDDSEATVDVIVPVYSGFDETLRCLYAVVSNPCRVPFRLTVINDASPDRALSAELERLAGLGLFRLLNNACNVGFVRTANRGLQESRQRDVVLLNADAFVHNDWLDRLRAHSRDELIASVTPLSNNATLASYPQRDADNRAVLEVDHATIDAAAADVNAGQASEVPTGVGFCFYMTRRAIDAVGLFDEQTFGRGYGEENDWCRRAAEHGLCNIVAWDVFVTHLGGVSFSDSAIEAQKQAGRRLAFLHPSYNDKVLAFHRMDPIAPARRAIDFWRVRRLSGGEGVLFILHRWGGGVARLVEAEMTRLERQGVLCLLAQPDESGRRLLLTAGARYDFPNLPPIALDEPGPAVETLKSLELGRVEVHSLVGLETTTYSTLLEVLSASRLPWISAIHDYTAICPRINMVDVSGGYCDTTSVSYCQTCVDSDGSPFGRRDVEQWRRDHRLVLEGSSEVRTPHPDVAERLGRHIPSLRNITVRPHPYLKRPDLLTREGKLIPPALLGTRRVALIGGLSAHKGSHLLLAMAADALMRRLPLFYSIFGETDMDDKLPLMRNVSVTGRYDETNLDKMLRETPCDLALFASVCPETFCFTLDHALRNGLYPVAFDLGALGARISSVGFGEVMPRSWMFDPIRVNDRLLALTATPAPAEFLREPGRAMPEAAVA